MTWNPAQTRATRGLNLSPDERKQIEANMAPLERGRDGL